eukprot:PhF_6_TR5703/c0_g1_i1/m.8402/K08176/PHO84; MFS transporter, PHS family, inorganic phosphate transporter
MLNLSCTKIHTYSSWVLKLGMGFFADAYDLFCIDVILAILKKLDTREGGALGITKGVQATLAFTPSLGAVIGMLLFGILGDRIGRKAASVTTALLVCFGCILCGLCSRQLGSFTLVDQLIMCQVLRGIGIGGEYPISASMAREHAPTKSQLHTSRHVAAVFSLQGFGMIASMLLGMILIQIFEMDVVWRLLFMVGAIPSAGAAYFRLHMDNQTPPAEPVAPKPPTPHPEGDNDDTTPAVVVTVVAPQNSAPAAPWFSFDLYRAYWKHLVATCTAWFLLDVTFYGSGQFKHLIAEEFLKHAQTPEEKIYELSVFGLWVALMGLPGYWCAAYVMDVRICKWNLQIIGFALLVPLYVCFTIIVSTPDVPMVIALLVFGVSLFISNFGPNTTTFVLPAELFPQHVRATLHGVSAACGKIGAIVGSLVFGTMSLPAALSVSAGVAVLGVIVSMWGKRNLQRTKKIDSGSKGKSSGRKGSYKHVGEDEGTEVGGGDLTVGTVGNDSITELEMANVPETLPLD